ncbi:hypothetical protein ACWLMY_35630 [Streptomyces anulatus]
MGEHNEGQDDVAELARPTATTTQARDMTTALRAAMDDVRRSVAVLAARVRAAHAAKVWLLPGFASWESYCGTEFGISRAQAYRLLDVARALAAIHDAIAAGPGTSRTRDSDPAAAAALDYGLSQRSLIAVSGRTNTVTQLIPADSPRLPTAASRPSMNRPCAPSFAKPSATSAPPRRPPKTLADPALAELRRAVDDLAAITHQLGELMLEVAPAYLSDTAAAELLVPLCDQIGETLDNGLASRRYALSGDRRALSGVL